MYCRYYPHTHMNHYYTYGFSLLAATHTLTLGTSIAPVAAAHTAAIAP